MSQIFANLAATWNGLDWAFVALVAGVLLVMGAVWTVLYFMSKSLEASE